MKRKLLAAIAMLFTIIAVAPAHADNAVKLRILVVATGEVAEDLGLAYIKPVLDEMGVPYVVLNAGTQDLTPAFLAASSQGTACQAEEAGCVGNYNGVILTDADLIPGFTPAEWDLLHNYRKTSGSGKRYCQGGQLRMRIRSRLTTSIWITVSPTPQADTIMMRGGQYRGGTARKSLNT